MSLSELLEMIVSSDTLCLGAMEVALEDIEKEELEVVPLYFTV